MLSKNMDKSIMPLVEKDFYIIRLSIAVLCSHRSAPTKMKYLCHSGLTAFCFNFSTAGQENSFFSGKILRNAV